MPIATVTFHSILQNSQIFGGKQDGQHMVATIHFTLEVDGKKYGMAQEIRQPYGTDFYEFPVEAKPSAGDYKGKWNHKAFLDECEKYYRETFGENGSGFSIARGKGKILMKDNMVIGGGAYMPESSGTGLPEKTIQFEIPD